MPIHAVIGLGRLGTAIATYLGEHGAEIIAIDADPARVDAVKDSVPRAVCLDATDERALRAAGVAECSTVVLALGEDELEQSVLCTMLLRELGVGRIIARVATDVQAKVLERLGVARVIFPERQIGIQVARQLLSPTMQEMMPVSEGISIAEVTVPSRCVGATLGALQLRRNYGLNAVALRRRSTTVKDDGTVVTAEEFDNLPGPDTALGIGDVLMVVGSYDAVRRFSEG